MMVSSWLDFRVDSHVVSFQRAFVVVCMCKYGFVSNLSVTANTQTHLMQCNQRKTESHHTILCFTQKWLQIERPNRTEPNRLFIGWYALESIQGIPNENTVCMSLFQWKFVFKSNPILSHRLGIQKPKSRISCNDGLALLHWLIYFLFLLLFSFFIDLSKFDIHAPVIPFVHIDFIGDGVAAPAPPPSAVAASANKNHLYTFRYFVCCAFVALRF